MGPIYDVAITALNAAAPADGFIDNKSSYNYMDISGDAPDSLANAKAKFRANRRYRNVVSAVQMMCNAYIVSTTAPGATADSPPTSITIRFQVEHDASVLSTPDETSPGTVLTGAAALKRCVARALIRESYIVRGDYYDPTVVAGRDIDGTDNAGRAKGAVIADETVGPLAANIAAAEAAITVTLVP